MEDLDNDGHTDIYLVGNFYGPEPMHTGTYDGGVSVWLHGDGAGDYEAVPVTESGLGVPTDAKGLAATYYDLDGWVDLCWNHGVRLGLDNETRGCGSGWTWGHGIVQVHEGVFTAAYGDSP